MINPYQSRFYVYHLGSRYEFYPECSEQVKKTAVEAMRILQIESGSLDIIENETAKYVVKKYKEL